MDKFKYIRVKQSSGEYGTSIPIAVDWSNVDNKPITVDSNGVIDIANIPKAALERLIIVADDTARFALTTATVQTGDTVKVTSTGQMYYIIDDTKLNVEAGYVQYSAGTAASVPWSGVSDKPTTISGYGITDAYTKTQTNNLLNNKVDKISGKGLSTNDYTTTEKNKLAGIAAGAEVNVNPDWNATSGDAAILNKPTTVDGYGITDAYTKSDIDDIVDTSDNTSEAENPLVIETDAAQYAKNTHLTLEPVQDLHGYDHPWPAGGGKNLLPQGNGSTSGAGITFSVSSDGVITATGTATDTSFWGIQFTLPAGTYILNGCPSGGGVSNYRIDIRNALGGVSISGINEDTGSGSTFTLTESLTAWLNVRIANGYACPSGGLVFKPMIRKSTESDATFEPYSNICPITPMGHKNLLPMTVEGIKAANTTGIWSGNVYTRDGVVFTILADDANNVIGIRATGTASSNLAVIKLPFTAELSGNYVLTGCPSGGAAGEQGTYNLRIGRTSASKFVGNETGNGFAFTASGNVYRVDVQIASVAGNVDLLFQPMIRPASDLDSTFVPYGMARIGASVTGFNQWDEEWETGYINVATGVNVAANDAIRSSFFQVNPGTTYHIKSPYAISSQKARIYFYDRNKNFIFQYDLPYFNDYTDQGNGNFTVIPNACYMRFTFANLTTPVTYNHDICINISDASKNGTYEPYQKYDAEVDLPEPVYSGTLDLETGELVVDMATVDLGTLTWTYFSEYMFFYSSGLRSNIKALPSTTTVVNALCEIYEAIPYSGNWGKDKKMWLDSSKDFSIRDYRYSDATTFKTAMSGVYLVYELATPITYQLTPQQLALFKGTNNVSTNAKTVQVTYRNGELATTGDIVASTEVAKQNAIGESASYTDAKLATELASILGNFATIEQPIATTNHSIGQLIVIDDSLRKITNTVAAGETFDSSNSSVTNVAAEFASVNILINKITPNATAGAHNGIYRGQDITQYFNDGSLWKRINGTNGYTLFEDLYIGDYITVGGRSYAIVDFDYYIRCGSQDLNQHHLVMMPTGLMNIPEGTVLYNPDTSATPETLLFINNTNASAAAGEEVTVQYQESANYFKWNATMLDPNTHTTNGGYKYSRMRTVIMRAADTLVVNAFGTDHVKPITVLYHNPSSASASGLANTWAWFDKNDWTDPMRKSICDLPNETQVYGQQVWGRGSAYTNMGYEVGIDKWQFAIFALQRNFANIRANWWLRSVISASAAAHVDNAGYAASYGSAYYLGVRPRFVLIG